MSQPTQYTKRSDKIKANQPSNNPYVKEVLSVVPSDVNRLTVYNLLQKLINYEQANIALRFLPYFKVTKLSQVIDRSRDTLYGWMSAWPHLKGDKS